MDWATNIIERLKNGETVTFRSGGNSMRPKINDGATVTVEPVDIKDVKKGDIVLCRVKGNHYLHLVKAVDNGRLLIGNNHGRINGWTRTVYGRFVRIEN